MLQQRNNNIKVNHIFKTMLNDAKPCFLKLEKNLFPLGNNVATFKALRFLGICFVL